MGRISMLRLAPACLAACSVNAAAQTEPAKLPPKITMTVSLAPGGGVDIMARLLADQLQARTGSTVIVENRPGGGGMTGAAALARSTPDGTTIGMLESSTMLHKWLHKNVPVDVTTEFVHIALIARSAMVLFAHPSLPASNVQELIALARANPGGLQVGTPGVGTTHHLTAMLLNHYAKINIAPVAYRGTAPALNDLLGGHLKMIWATPVAVMTSLQAGKVKALATASPKRVAGLPNVQTIAENGLPGFDLESWFGVAAPVQMPKALVERFRRELREITALPDVQQRITAQSFWLDFREGAQFKEMVEREHKRLGEAIQAAGIKPE